MIFVRHVVAALGLAAGLAFSASAGVIYLKDGATGDGSGSSWANACSNIAQAVTALNASSDSPAELRVAQGIYPISAAQTITHPNFLIRGGWRAQADGDTERDIEEYQSIISGYGKSSYNWYRYDPVTNVRTDPTEGIFKNGKIQYPDMTGCSEYAFCYPKHAWVAPKISFLTVSAAGGGEINGLIFTGNNQGTVVTITAGGPGTIVSDCLITGCSMGLGFSIGATTVPSHVRRCTLRYNSTANHSCGGVYLGGGTCYFEDSTFDGNIVSDTYNAGLCGFGSSLNVITNCVFSRIYYSASGNDRSTSYDGGACLFVSKSNNPKILDSAISNCFTRTAQTNSHPAPLGACRTGVYSGLFISNNVCQTYVRGSCSYSPFADPAKGTGTATWSNCVFVANRIEVKGKTTTSYVDGDVCVGTLGNGMDGSCLKVFGCVFDSNEVVLPTDPSAITDLNFVQCRGVLLQAVAEGKTSAATVDHCTFLGPVTNGIYDIAQFGPGHTKAFTLRNSIFQRTDTGIYETPFYVAVPTYNSTVLFAPVDVTIQNLTRQPSSDYTVTGLAYDKVPLDAAYRPLARTPELMTTTDGLPRGAKPLAPGVAAGHSLTVRLEPLDAGTLTAGGTHSVPAGQAIQPVTVAVNDPEGSVFAGWFYDGASTYVTKSLTLSGVTLTEDKVVVAKFTTRPVAVTFDLDGKGVFASTGTDQFTTNTNAGLDFPVCTEPFTISDGWLFIKWDDTPAKVPSGVDAVTVGAKIVTTDVRTVYLTTTGAGKKDGTSWANAYGDLQTAIDDAAICRGEVWAREGVYKIPTKIDLRSNVALRGGFIGAETRADQADPAERETIFTGDQNLGNYWTTNGVRYGYIVADGKIQMPANDNDSIDVIWRHAFSSTPTSYGFSRADGADAVTNVAFSGVTFACFLRGAVTLASGSSATFDTCRFLACGEDTYWSKSSAALASSGQVSLENCRFTCNYMAASLGAGATATNRVASTTFEYGHTQYGTCGLSINGAAPTTVTNCLFRRNCALYNVGYSSPASAIGVGRGALANVRVLDTRFVKNRTENGAIATVMIRDDYNYRPSEVSFARCRFSGNRFSATAPFTSGYCMEFQPGSAGIASLSTKPLVVRDTVFETNEVRVAVAAGSVSSVRCNYSSAIGVGVQDKWSSASARVLNCAFVGNVATDASGAALPYPVGTFSTGYLSSGVSVSLVHCLFKDSVVTSPRASADVALVGSATETVTLLDDVFWSDAAADYVPFSFDTAATPQLWACVVKNYDPDVFAATDQWSYAESVWTEAPKYSPTNPLKLKGGSPGSRGGTPVYESAAGAWYFKDETHFPSAPWRNVQSRTSTAASVSGLSEKPVPDMDGTARTRRISCGPLSAGSASICVTVF